MIIHSIIPAWKIPQRSLTGYSQHTLSHFSRVRLFAPPWTVASRLLCPWDSPGKNTGVGCHFLLQGSFPTQGSNLHLMSPALAGGFFTAMGSQRDTTERLTLRSRCVPTWPGVQGQQPARINNRSATGVPPDSTYILFQACKTHLPRAYLA